MRRFDVFFGDGLGFQPDAYFERARGGFNGRGIGGFLGRQQTLVILDRKFRVDRQPDRARVGAAALPWQPDRKLDHFARPRSRGDVGCVLVLREQVGEQGRKLHLAEGAARLDVGQHAFEIADALGQGMHLAQAALHGFEPFADQLERFAQTLFERRMQLLVDRAAHLVELFRVVGLQLADFLFERRADLGQAPLVGLGQLADTQLLLLAKPHQGLRKTVDLIVLLGRNARHLRGQRLLEVGQMRRQLGALGLGALRNGVAQFALGALLAAVERIEAQFGLGGTAVVAPAHQQHDLQNEHDREGDQDEDGQGIGHAPILSASQNKRARRHLPSGPIRC